MSHPHNSAPKFLWRVRTQAGAVWFKGPKPLTAVPPLICKALPGIFLCIFSFLTYLKKPVFSKMDLLQWKVPARLYWDLLTVGRYQPACHYFWKNPSSALCRKRTWVPALGTDLKSWKGMYSGPSPIPKGFILEATTIHIWATTILT